MESATGYNPPRKSKGPILILCAVLAVGFAGAYAYKTLFARPGEAAFRFVPADSSLVVSIDLSPSPGQALAFKSIDDSLKRNGFSQFNEDSILKMVSDNPASKELAPLIRHGGAVCLEQTPGTNTPTGMAFVALTDGPKAMDILKSHFSVQFYKGIKYFKPQGPVVMTVFEDLLVISDKPEEFDKVKQIQDGSMQSITSLPEFKTARDQLEGDANVLFFVSPKLWSSLVKTGSGATEPDWIAMGLAVRDGGVSVSFASRTDLVKHPEAKEFASIPPVRSDLFEVIPTGSYGMAVYSDPAVALKAFERESKKGVGSAFNIQDTEKSIEKQTGMSLKDDLIPALTGDAVIAAYPSDTGDPTGLDLLLVFDDQNGGDPANAFDKFAKYIDEKTLQGTDHQKLFVTKSIDGGTEYRLDSKFEGEVHKELGKGVNDQELSNQLKIGDKTFAVDVIGKTVFMATSQDLLDRSVACYRSKTGGLKGDSNFEQFEKTLMDGSQSMGVASISRIAKGVENALKVSHMDKDTLKTTTSILDTFAELKDPLYMKGKMNSEGLVNGNMFIPLDYDKLIDTIGSATHQHKKGAAATEM